MTPKQKFLANVHITWNCWEWVGPTNSAGNGSYTAEGKIWPAHYYSYHIYVGELKDSRQVERKCHNRLCVRPDHLEQTAIRDNMLRIKPGRRITKHIVPCANGHKNMVLTVDGQWVCGTCLAMTTSALSSA